MSYFKHTEWESPTSSKFIEEFAGTIPVVIHVYSEQNAIIDCKLPGIGQLYKDGKLCKELKFDPENPCKQGIKSFSEEWYEMKNPLMKGDQVDLKLAAHRGFWGYDLGRGPAENTEPSIEAAAQYTKIIESDVVMTADSVIVVSHDYNLQRLTDYDFDRTRNDFDNKFIYNLPYDSIKDLHLRKRNFDVTEFKVITLDTLLSYMKKYNTVLTIDVKDKAPRINPNVSNERVCTATCDDVGETAQRNFVDMLSKIMDVIRKNDAWEYTAVKTALSISQIKKLLPIEQHGDLRKMLFFPLIQPSKTSKYAVSFINDWYNNAANSLVSIETNFKSPDSELLKPVQIQGERTFQNMLEYVIYKTDLRPGIYSEEPGGPKGVVDRYAQWKFKDTYDDYRGDPIWLMSIPSFNKTVITADRPDIWKQIEHIYGGEALRSVSADNSSETDLAKIDDPTIIANTKISAKYESGSIIISGLNKNDIGKSVMLYDLQGALIYQNTVAIEPQMTLSKTLQSGVFILKIAGDRQAGLKLIVN
jgi:hypothetical protein